MSSSDPARSWWDRVAWAYDLQAWLEQSALHRAVRLADVQPGERVLDAGCGTGQWLRLLIASHSAPARLAGVDQSEAMLDRAGGAGVELTRADVRALPFADASFDVVCLAYVLHVLADSDVPVVLAELRRVLGPDGRLVTVTPWPASTLRRRLLAAVAERLADTRWSAMAGFRPLDPTIRLEECGFRVEATVDVGRGYRSRCIRAVVVGRR